MGWSGVQVGSFFAQHFGVSLQEFASFPRDRAAAVVRERCTDLLHFFGRSSAAEDLREPARVQRLAISLQGAMQAALQPAAREWQGLCDRIVVDGFTRSEYDRDQNVYLGSFYTRLLTRAVPDLIFQPTTHRELEAAVDWARRSNVKICTRGAGSTAMGGAVPNDGGLLLEMSRFDEIQVDTAAAVAVIGAGARFKQIHRVLGAQGLALKTYPSNLGGTLAGWFSAGGLGLNSFKYGPVQNQVRALSVVLPRGQHVRFHDDGRLDVLGPDEPALRLTPEQAELWQQEHRYPVRRLADLAQSEGQFGVLLQLTMDVVPLPEHAPFFFEFDEDVEALHFAQWVAETAESRRSLPTNLKYLSRQHVEAVRRVRGDVEGSSRPAVYVDFDDAIEAARFEGGLASGKWRVQSDAGQAQQWFADRFRPQQTKRLGPGFLAAEILLPTRHLERFLERAVLLANGVGIHLESEVYYFRDGLSLALPGYLTRGPRFGFLFELVLAPMLVELAMRRYDGEPYVLGRWQAAFFRNRFRAGTARVLRRAKRSADPGWLLNPGVYFRPAFRLSMVTLLFRTSFALHLALLRRLYAVRPFARLVRALVTRGAPPQRVMTRAAALADAGAVAVAADLLSLAKLSRGCVNCGECNAVCPIFHDAKIRLPQMLTHIGETMQGRSRLDGSRALLLDMCMRCGNCEEVCQAGIPHLALYAAMEVQSGSPNEERHERHLTLLTQLRYSERYNREFLGVRPGGYVHRTPASLPGEVRYLLFRAENDAGAASTCLHCGACVPVCPTGANFEYQDRADPRRILTDQTRCIGCGTCVEICPANLANGGQTLRVVEAPGREFFEILEMFEAGVEGRPT